MALTPSITEDDVFLAVRAFLLAIVPTGVEVIQGQENRVAEPGDAGAAYTFVVMTPTGRAKLATNVDTWSYDAPPLPAPTTKQIAHNAQFDMQLDLHGPGGSDIASAIAAAFVDDWGRDILAVDGIAPLFATDGNQIPFVNRQNQYENRWVMTLTMQINPSVSTPQDFAATLTPTINAPVEFGGT